MGREIIKKEHTLPAFLKSNKYFLFIGPKDLSDIEFSFELASIISNSNLMDNVRLSFYSKVYSNRISDNTSITFDQSMAILFNIQNKFSLPIACNLGDWKN